jgi:hypothetical protein
MNGNTPKFVLKVFFLLFILFSLFLLFLFLLFIYKNKNDLLQEGFESDTILTTKAAFCESHRGSSNTLNEDCSKLTQRNCKSTSCCVFTSEDKCVAGGQGGPTFNSDEKGKTKHLDYYYFQDTCYGANCPY